MGASSSMIMRENTERSASMKSDGGAHRSLAIHANIEVGPKPAENGSAWVALSSSHAVYEALSQEQTVTKKKTDGSYMRQVIDHEIYQLCICVLIFANAIAMGIESDYALQNFSSPKHHVFRQLNTFFSIIFALELLLQICVLGAKHFTMVNVFDTVLVVTQVVQCILDDFYSLTPAQQHLGSVLRMCRCARVLRIIRLANVFELMELRMLVMTLVGSFRSLIWTIMLILLCTYTFSLYLTDVIADHWMENPEKASSQDEIRDCFGSFYGTILTLYQAVSDGVAWKTIMEPLTVEISAYLAIPFIGYISFMIFAFLNVITGVFLNAAMLTAEDDKRRVMGKSIRKMFETTDVDGSGAISWDEFSAQIQCKNMNMCLKAIDIQPEQAQQLFHLLDEDQSGEVSIAEFVGGCMKLQGSVKALDFAAFAVDQRFHNLSILESLEALGAEVRGIKSHMRRMSVAPAPATS